MKGSGAEADFRGGYPAGNSDKIRFVVAEMRRAITNYRAIVRGAICGLSLFV